MIPDPFPAAPVPLGRAAGKVPKDNARPVVWFGIYVFLIVTWLLIVAIALSL